MTRERDPVVIWVNTGKAYPETLEVIERVRAQSRFVEVATDQEAQNRRHGIPADLVPIDWTELGMRMHGAKSVKIQSYLQCCYENLSGPLNAKVKELGVTTLITGQRLDDGHRGKHGDVVDGVRHEHPLENWTRDMVMAYLRERGDWPEHFRIAHSSLDCYDCTAYRRFTRDRIEWTKEAHPELYARYVVRESALNAAIAEAECRS